MTAATEKISTLRSLETDEQLAILWYAYQEVKGDFTPEPEREGENLGNTDSLVSQIEQMSEEEQLQIQRDLIAGSDRQEFQTYKSYSSNQKLYFWYRLAAEMEQNSVVSFPNDYSLSSGGQKLLELLKEEEFTQQLVFIRDAVGISTEETSRV